jgi:hypothetical protein
VPHRRLLLALLGTLLLTTAAYLAVTAASGDGDADVTATGEDASGEGSPTTAAAADDTTTSTAPATTAPPDQPLVAGAPPPRPGGVTSPRAPRTVPALAPTTTASTAAPPTTAAPAFASEVQVVTAAQLGSSWRPGCPMGPEQLRAVEVSHWGYDGQVHTGRAIVDAAHAERMVAAFRDLFAARFPIQRMVPIDQYGGDDQASMRANNTSAFNCRYVAGTTSWSEHSYGRAIDVNPLMNPYVKGGTVDPPEGAPYADRSRTDPGMIHDGDAAVRAFAAQGWSWGGYWTNGKDYQHFSASGR